MTKAVSAVRITVTFYARGDSMPELPIDDDERFAVEEAVKRYDPTRIYVKASDDAGHSATVRFPTPKYLINAVSTVALSPLTPFRSVNDAHRDALYHWLMYWQRALAADLPPMVHPAISLMDYERREEEEALLVALKEKLERELRQRPATWAEFDKNLQLLNEQAPQWMRADIEDLQDRSRRAD